MDHGVETIKRQSRRAVLVV